LQRELQVLASLATGVALAPQVEIIGLEIFRRLDGQGFEFLRRKGDAQ
jgi:hypothetical protein